MLLLSLVSQLRAINMRNTAQMNMMNISNRRMSMINNMQSFGGLGMSGLAKMDAQMDMEMAKNSTLYQIACAQEEAADKRRQQEAKKGIDLYA